MDHSCEANGFPNRNRHHMIPRSRLGGDYRSNLLLIKIKRHEAWHRCFGNDTWIEAFRRLRQGYVNLIHFNEVFNTGKKELSPKKAAQLVWRVWRAKNRQSGFIRKGG